MAEAGSRASVQKELLEKKSTNLEILANITNKMASLALGVNEFVDFQESHEISKAKENFQAMHQFNKEKKGKPFYFITDVSLGHQDSQEKNFDPEKDDIQREAEFFAKFSMLLRIEKSVKGIANLPKGKLISNVNLPKSLEEELELIKESYISFLNDNSETLFVNSEEGKKASSALAEAGENFFLNINTYKAKNKNEKLWKLYVKLYQTAFFEKEGIKHQKELASLMQSIYLALTSQDQKNDFSAYLSSDALANGLEKIIDQYLESSQGKDNLVKNTMRLVKKLKNPSFVLEKYSDLFNADTVEKVEKEFKNNGAILNIQDINGTSFSELNLKVNGQDNKTIVVLDSKDGLETYYGKPEVKDQVQPGSEQEKQLNNLKTLGKESHSIIPIKKIMFFYITRFVNAFVEGSDHLKSSMIKELMEGLSKEIDADMSLFFCKIENDGQDLIAKMNAFVDKKRQSYANSVENRLASLLLEKKYENKYSLKSKKEVKDYFKNYTATENGIIENNIQTGIISYVSGVKYSSHSKATQDAAFTNIQKFVVTNEEGQGLKVKRIQNQNRVPSLVNKHSSILSQIEPFFEEILENRDETEKDKPIIYNLLTSLPKGFEGFLDSTKSYQTSTAKENFQAMHEFNKNKKKQPFYFIMNVPVNQHTRKLNFKSKKNGIGKEAAFFAAFCMFLAMPENFRSSFQHHIENIKKNYITFLTNDPRSDYFVSSEQGAQAIESLKKIEEDLVTNINQVEARTNADKLWKVYIKLYHSAFFDREGIEHQRKLSSLIQMMFLALTNNDNLKGCKSAVDRFSFVENGNDLLLAYLNGSLEASISTQFEENINTYLQPNNNVENISKARSFTDTFHKLNDRYNAYGSGFNAAYNDAGDAKNKKAKLDKNSNISDKSLEVDASKFYNTNDFIPDVYSRNEQEYAKSLQAEKKACKRALGLWDLIDNSKQDQEAKKAQISHGSQKFDDQDYRQHCIFCLETYIGSETINKLTRNFIPQAKMALQNIKDQSDYKSEEIKNIIVKLDKETSHRKSSGAFSKTLAKIQYGPIPKHILTNTNSFGLFCKHNRSHNLEEPKEEEGRGKTEAQSQGDAPHR